MREIEIKCICGKPIEIIQTYSTVYDRLCGTVHCKNCGLKYIKYGQLDFYINNHSQDEIEQDREYIENELIKYFGVKGERR